MKTILLLSLILMTIGTSAQIENGYYSALERMCWKDKTGKLHCYDAPRKWYHENLAYVEGDSIFIFKMPLQIVGKQKMYSAADGAFYYYLGRLPITGTDSIVRLVSNNCDYCGVLIDSVDSTTGFAFPHIKSNSFKFKLANNGFRIDTLLYTRMEKDPEGFPQKKYFYFDSNSIYRVEPRGQYKLICTGIKNFLQTKDLKLDHDTLRICLDRTNIDGFVEKLDASKFQIDTTGIVFNYYSLKELKQLPSRSNKPIRYIQVNQIIDYWKAARVSLQYSVLLPKSIHNFSDREYFHLFEYNKVGGEYVLTEGLGENDWGLIEQK